MQVAATPFGSSGSYFVQWIGAKGAQAHKVKAAWKATSCSHTQL